MIRANASEKNLVINILSRSFERNGSVNYVVKDGGNRMEHIRALIGYSFNVCNTFGDVWISCDEQACALVLYPDKKHTTINSILWDVNLAISVVGLNRLYKILKREKKVKALHPKEPFTYLWFIGVLPKKQNNGIGSQLLQDIIHESWIRKRPIYLETSVERNLSWYSKHGFETYQTLDFDYKLHLLKRENIIN